MELLIEGYHLPGRMFRDAGVPIHDVHVGVQIGKVAEQLVAGDAERAEWRVELRVEPFEGGWDVKGSAVHGRRGERFVYLTWGNVGVDGGFAMFRRLKLMLDPIDPELIGRCRRRGAAAADQDRSHRPLRRSAVRTARPGDRRLDRVIRTLPLTLSPTVRSPPPEHCPVHRG